MIILDAFLVIISFILAYYLRFKMLLFITPDSIPLFEKYFGVLIFVVISWLAIFKLVGLYEKKGLKTPLDEIASVFSAVTAGALFLFGMLFIYKGFWVSRLVIGNAWFICLVLMSASRIAYDYFQRHLHRRGVGVKKVLIVGKGEMGEALIAKFKNEPELGYRVAKILDDTSGVKSALSGQKIDEVIIADPNLSYKKVLDIITECEGKGIEFKLVPGILELIASRVDIDEVGGIPLLTVSEIGLKGFKAFLKRTFDILLSGLLLLILLPFFILVAIIIKLDSRGPVFFAQERVGKDGKLFKMFKFRSMIMEAEKLFPKLAPLSEVEGHIFKIKNDPRITKVGWFMRRLSIDELPQLINVFKGEMSLVGPRPPLPREVEKYNAWEKKRLRVAPGITGLWQVSGRSLLPFEDMVRLDIFYIENWSLWLDIKIMLKTIPVTIFAKGAY